MSNKELSLGTHTYEEIVASMESGMERIGGSRSMSRQIHAAMGAVTEAGELMDHYKRHLFYGTEVDQVNIIEELGDILWYMALMCNVFDVTLWDVMVTNVNKLKLRYPEKFTTDKAVNRDLEAERKSLESDVQNSIRQIDIDTE